MAQQKQSDFQETVTFGEADVFIEPLVSKGTSADSQQSIVRSSAMVEETLSTDRTQQNERRVVNYGPCIVCNINKACILFIGCNHLACCGRCSESCGNFCPVPNCNHPIAERLHVFEPL